ncbi:hypothetical protein B0J12DRAFT_206091 [Macrophomina phaseolina]|uniref:Uncharacterized protein n=1 Tax=Macrophomina phaseolina TaxID=35725 RepID=A0ABQ8G2A6_9PEZI|nr:hypothetical protein B0J12DRAFT_206091 [Macrophomina phaseolina]
MAAPKNISDPSTSYNSSPEAMQTDQNPLTTHQTSFSSYHNQATLAPLPTTSTTATTSTTTPNKKSKKSKKDILRRLSLFAKLGPPLPQRTFRRATTEDAEHAVAAKQRMSLDDYRLTTATTASSRTRSNGDRSSQYSQSQTASSMHEAQPLRQNSGGEPSSSSSPGGLVARISRELSQDASESRQPDDSSLSRIDWEKAGGDVSTSSPEEEEDDIPPRGRHRTVARVRRHQNGDEEDTASIQPTTTAPADTHADDGPPDEIICSNNGLTARVEHNHASPGEHSSGSKGKQRQQSPRPRVDSIVPSTAGRQAGEDEDKEGEERPRSFGHAEHMRTGGPPEGHAGRHDDTPPEVKPALGTGDDGAVGKLKSRGRRYREKGREKLARTFFRRGEEERGRRKVDSEKGKAAATAS